MNAHSMSTEFSLFVCITFSLSSIVFIEPSPYDLLLFLLLVLALFRSYLSYHSTTILPLILLFIFFESNLFSMFFSIDDHRALLFGFITLYLLCAWVGIVGLVNRFKLSFISVVFQGYTVASILAVSVAILAYIGVIPYVEQLIMEGRFKSFFKDPNVFGAFLIPPSLYALLKIEMSDRNKLQFFYGFWLFFFFFCYLQ